MGKPQCCWYHINDKFCGAVVSVLVSVGVEVAVLVSLLVMVDVSVPGQHRVRTVEAITRERG